jgi:ABC-2 type transport system permease protein
MLVLGASMGLAHGLSTGDPWTQTLRIAGAAVAMVPAAWVLGALTMVLVSAAPRWAPWAWTTVLLAFFLSLVGPLAKLNHWVLDLSPFTHIPKLPGEPMLWTPLIWLTAITLLLCAAALAALERRDLT